MFKSPISPRRHEGTKVHKEFFSVSLSLCVFAAILFSFNTAFSQVKPKDKNQHAREPAKENKTINVKHAGSLTYDRDKSNAKFLTGNVVFEHDGALLNCDTALLFEEENR